MSTEYIHLLQEYTSNLTAFLTDTDRSILTIAIWMQLCQFPKSGRNKTVQKKERAAGKRRRWLCIRVVRNDLLEIACFVPYSACLVNQTKTQASCPLCPNATGIGSTLVLYFIDISPFAASTWPHTLAVNRSGSSGLSDVCLSCGNQLQKKTLQWRKSSWTALRIVTSELSLWDLSRLYASSLAFPRIICHRAVSC